MFNSKPNKAGNYKSGNYMPKNREKFYKFNSEGGIYYRSSLEYKVLLYLDAYNENVTKIAVEHLTIPYTMKKVDNTGAIVSVTNHRYFIDVYYEMTMDDGSTKRIALEIKPSEQTKPPVFKETAKMTKKQLENYKYSVDEWNRNMSKWDAAIQYCESKGIKFRLITEKEISKLFS